MINFTVGPVQSCSEVLAIGAEQVPYFRTPSFSAVMKENERLMLEFVNAPEGSRAVFITGSGTASMEAVVMGVLDRKDSAIVINGGTFGERFCQLCDLHGIKHSQVRLSAGCQVTQADLEASMGASNQTALLVNAHETSTGVLYDMDLISKFCETNGLLLVVDAISAFLSDPIDMKKSGMDVVITGSQKALACPPGVSIVLLSPKALSRVWNNQPRCMYLDLSSALSNGERGQTPFTPAVGTLLQINARLRQIGRSGGVVAETARIKELALDFREKIVGLPFEISSKALSNAVTPLHPTSAKASVVVSTLRDEYDIWVCPNGGNLADEIFRVGHIGDLTTEDNDALIAAMRDMRKRGII